VPATLARLSRERDTTEHEATIRSEDRVLIRAIRPEDKRWLLDVFHRLSPESRYRRFFSAATGAEVA
jgi:hypothetical protein